MDRFPDILTDDRGVIILCPQCGGSSITRQWGDEPQEIVNPLNLLICNACGTMWRRP